MNHRESEIQRACVKYFDLQYPKYRQLFFCIPNGGARSKTEAAIMKGEGVRAGVADMFLAVQAGQLNFGLFIEFKMPGKKQTDEQKKFEAAVKNEGYRYEVITSVDGFRELVDGYFWKLKSNS